MKNLDELYKEVLGNDELKNAFAEALKEGKIADFLKAHDCDAAVEDVMALLNNKKEGEAGDDDLARVAGGGRCQSSSCCGVGCPSAY